MIGILETPTVINSTSSSSFGEPSGVYEFVPKLSREAGRCSFPEVAYLYV